MADPLKTFLERARDGGWEDKVTAFLVQHPDMMGHTKEAWILWLIFNPEAAKAVWPPYVHSTALGELSPWRTRQRSILRHIQNGDTPLEALEKEL